MFDQLNPIISIGILTYNRAERLDKCLNSIFKQIGNDNRIEVIVSDNASTDNTVEILKDYECRFDNFRFYRNETNLGAVENLFIVLDKLRGEYLFPHGDDDYFKDGALYDLLNCVQSHTECSLFYIDVLSDSGTVFSMTGMDKYLGYASIYSTFISSFIMKKQDYDLIKDKRKFAVTYIPHLYMIYCILKANPNFLVLCRKIYDQEAEQSPGGYIYSFADTMIKGYFDILTAFVGEGLSLQNVSDEKRKLARRTLWYYEFGLKRKDLLFIKDFEEIFMEYYKNEPYFSEAYGKVLELKQSYII
jgi:glycosyltransferase involved in cell wall biosynthesis